jgi:protein-tyrosine phosphatase
MNLFANVARISPRYNMQFIGCLRNICRSPMAEFILKALVRSRGIELLYHIESAAVSTEEIGNPIYPPAKRSLSQHGVWFDPSKRARQVTPEDYGRFDRIVCMDSSNLRLLRRIIPSDPEGKVHLLMSYTGAPRDVADPWYTGDFEEAFQDILAGCEAMLG